MRITSGKARGISLSSPKGDATRPATDAARLAIFSSLGARVEGARVLDLFAGTGAYGLEALSRGAQSCLFAETSRPALLCLQKNSEGVLKALGADKSVVKILASDVFKLRNEESFDLIFADPPYDILRDTQTLSKLLSLFESLAGPETLIILEAPAEVDIPEGCAFEVLKRLGKSSKGKPSQILLSLKNHTQ